MLHEIDLSRTDLNLLVLFEAVLAERHVGRAAERLSLSPSAVSHGLGRLRRLLNDPLFLRTPKGVIPTARAEGLAAPIEEVLARVRNVLATAEPFVPSTSTRRFVIGAPDGISAVLLPGLLAEVRLDAPGIDLGIRQLMPTPGEASPQRSWRSTFADLETRKVDIAIVPATDVPARFHVRGLFAEDFVVAMRAGHPFARSPTLERYCDCDHLIVSHNAEPFGFVDQALAEAGLKRRVALTVPNFMFALGVLAESDLLCALPRRLVRLHGPRYDLVACEPPVPFLQSGVNAVVPHVALMDAGLSWLLDRLLALTSRDGAADAT